MEAIILEEISSYCKMLEVSKIDLCIIPFFDSVVAGDVSQLMNVDCLRLWELQHTPSSQIPFGNEAKKFFLAMVVLNPVWVLAQVVALCKMV